MYQSCILECPNLVIYGKGGRLSFHKTKKIMSKDIHSLTDYECSLTLFFFVLRNDNRVDLVMKTNLSMNEFMARMPIKSQSVPKFGIL